MGKLNLLIITITTLLFIFSIAESMRFEMKSGLTKCISEDIKSNSMTVGKYSIVNPNEGFPLPDSHKLIVKVSSSHGSLYHHEDRVESGNFAFTTGEDGDYATCFWVKEQRPEINLTVDFEWRTGVAAKDWSQVARKGQIDVMELELKKLHDTVTSIHDEMFYLRERQCDRARNEDRVSNRDFR